MKHVKPLGDSLRALWRGLKLIVAASPRAAMLYLGLMVLVSLLPVLQVWLAKEVVDALTRASGGALGVAGAALTLAGLYALVLVFEQGLQPTQQTLGAHLEDRAVAEVDRHLIRAGGRMTDLVRLERPALQDELQHVQQASLYTPRLFESLQQGPAKLITLLGLLVLLARLHPLVPVVLSLTLGPHLFTQHKLEERKYQAMRDRSRAAREMMYSAKVTIDPVSAKEVRVFGLGNFFLTRYQRRFEEAFRELNRARSKQLGVSAAFSALNALALAGGFWYVASRAATGQLTLGDIALYLSAVQQAQVQLIYVPMWFGHLHEAILHLRGLFTFLDNAKPAVKLTPAAQALTPPETLTRGIELKHVRFRYPESSQAVLENVSFTLPAGKVTAIVGANGAGKSTLVKLLTRMYDPDGGTILLDGEPLEAYDLTALRERIAVVYQDFARFALTLRDNITVSVSHGHTDLSAKTAAQWSGADAVARKLPAGYDTELTRRFEGGVELSGGEWQKVAVARGFLRDAALVVLDEPTAALDADAETRLFEQFRKLVRGKTALIISHRFSTVRMADKIVVLEQGRVLEAGAHHALVAQGGRYAELFEMQAGRYR